MAAGLQASRVTLVGGLDVQANRTVADPVRPRIYCGTPDGVVVVDTRTATIMRTIPGGSVVDLSLSPDGGTLWVIRSSTQALGKLDLELLDRVVDVPVSERVLQVCDSSKGTLFAAATNGDVLQLDPTTGTIRYRFTPTPGIRHAGRSQLEISRDGRTLYVADWFYVGDSLSTHSAVARYDVSAGTPALMQRIELTASVIWDLTLAPRGDTLYVLPGRSYTIPTSGYHEALCISADDLAVTRGVLWFAGNASGPVTIAKAGNRALVPVIRGDDGSTSNTSLAYLFDAASFHLDTTVVAGSTWSAGGGAFVGLSDAVVDSSGAYLYLATDLYPNPLRIYTIEPTPPAPAPAKTLLNISTRMQTDAGAKALIGGFIITGSGSKRVMVRAIGPSLPVPGKLADPVLELHSAAGGLIAENDEWKSQLRDIVATGIAPLHDREASIMATLPAGAYTAVLRGKGGMSGLAAVEVYDLSPSTTCALANISSRGWVGTTDNVMIAGCIIGGDLATRIAVRALGPTLERSGVTGALSDPTLEVRDADGSLIADNDDWANGDGKQALLDAGIAPASAHEAAVIARLPPGAYTGIVRGSGGTSGVALVEIYNLDTTAR